METAVMYCEVSTPNFTSAAVLISKFLETEHRIDIKCERLPDGNVKLVFWDSTSEPT
jgi:hypothetical protein